MYKKFVRTVIVIGVLGFIAYKAYEYFVKKNNTDVVDAVDTEFMDDGELELNTEETFVDKLKNAAKSVLG